MMTELVINILIALFVFIGIRSIWRTKCDAFYLRPAYGECYIVNRRKKWRIVDQESKFIKKIRVPYLDRVGDFLWVDDRTKSGEVVPSSKLEHAINLTERVLYINGYDVSFKDIAGATVWLCIRYKITDLVKLFRAQDARCGEDFVNSALVCTFYAFSKITAVSCADYTNYTERKADNLHQDDFQEDGGMWHDRRTKKSVTFNESRNGTVGDIPTMIKAELSSVMKPKGVSILSVVMLKLELPQEARSLMLRLMEYSAMDKREEVSRDKFVRMENERDIIAKHRFDMLKTNYRLDDMSLDQTLTLIKISYSNLKDENIV